MDILIVIKFLLTIPVSPITEQVLIKFHELQYKISSN